MTIPHTPPLPPPLPDIHVQPPMVFVEPVWQYKHVVRKPPHEPTPDEAELNALGAKGWELVAVASEGGALHLYFKRLVR